MTLKRVTALVCMIFLASTFVSGFENARFRLAPSLGYSSLNTEGESSYGETDRVSMHDFSYGIDLFIERQMNNRNLFIGADLGYQFMTGPYTDNSGLGDDPDISVSSYFIGPAFRYFFNEAAYLTGTFGLAILSSSGDDDFMDSNLFGPGFSLGGGYDFPTLNRIQFGLYARLLCHFVFGDDSETEVEYSGRQFTPAVGVSMLF